MQLVLYRFLEDFSYVKIRIKYKKKGKSKMANKITSLSERYVDTPLTNFPVSEDNIDRMSDITSDLMPIVIQYNQYIQSGNITEANNLLKSNPRLMSCFFKCR